MKISGNEVKPGMLIEHKDDLWEVLKTQHVKPGKGGAFNQVEMKSVNRGIKLNERFRSSDTVEKATLEEIDLNFLLLGELIVFIPIPMIKKFFLSIFINSLRIAASPNFEAFMILGI